MSKLSATSASLNRLRANPELIPLIEPELASNRMTRDRAALMAKFCAWTTQGAPDAPEGERIIKVIATGLERVSGLLEAARG